MMPLLGAILLASLVGSTHCVGMCGAFVTLAVGAPDARAVSAWRLQSAYHLGRLTTYTSVVALAGLIGSSIDLSAMLVGVQNLALMVSASLVGLFASFRLLALAGVRLPRHVFPAAWTRLVEHGHRAAWTLTPVPRAAAIGALTTLLPCGWLYAFVAIALGMGGPAPAALVMVAFWIGTVPLLAAVGMGARKLVARPGSFIPVATTVVLLLISAATLAGRGRILGLTLPGVSSNLAGAPICHPAIAADAPHPLTTP